MQLPPNMAGTFIMAPLLAAALILPACETPPKRDRAPDSSGVHGPVEQAALPTPVAIEAAQRARLEKLLPLHASGQVELRWVDEDGRHFEFCRGDLFVDLTLAAASDGTLDATPATMLADGPYAALDLRKVGERFMYVGCDPKQSWSFDLRSQPRRLRVQPHGTPVDPAAIAGLSALDLVDLAGLGPWHMEPTATVRPDDNGKLVVIATGLGGPLLLTLDPYWLVPLRVELLGQPDGAALTSTLEEYRGIERAGLPPGGLPRLPERLRLFDATGETSVMISLATVDDDGRAVAPGLFDLDRLIRILRPEVVEGLNTSASGSAASLEATPAR